MRNRPPININSYNTALIKTQNMMNPNYKRLWFIKIQAWNKSYMTLLLKAKGTAYITHYFWHGSWIFLSNFVFMQKLSDLWELVRTLCDFLPCYGAMWIVKQQRKVSWWYYLLLFWFRMHFSTKPGYSHFSLLPELVFDS
jgi:hypothetical protein